MITFSFKESYFKVVIRGLQLWTEDLPHAAPVAQYQICASAQLLKVQIATVDAKNRAPAGRWFIPL